MKVLSMKGAAAEVEKKEVTLTTASVQCLVIVKVFSSSMHQTWMINTGVY